MGMNVLSLMASLGMDTSEYEKGLKSAEGLANSAGSTIGNGLKNAAKIGAAAIGAATTAVGAFAASSVGVGANFDQSMSQVAATMGVTTGEIEELRNFAEEMGRTTAFSATQAADALNYMALAGYDAQTSMEMLPNVLNLAAAGGMDLARASDMVTDTQTAFGISLERTAQMVDEMAKAASTGNTSVEQLGDAFLTVGGLAQELNGGMVTLADGTQKPVDGVQELEIALTAMANAGVKGSEAGTHMRNMLLKLTSPTDDGAAAMEALGVSVFDTEGKMRSLSDIFGDLSGALSNLTQEEKIQVISDLFNTRDLASAEALLNAVNQDWDSIGASILDAEGAASKMAETQLDNLAGDITLFKSALEGAQIAISDKLIPTFRDFVQFGTKGISEVTDAFEKGGLDRAVDKFGSIISDGITMIVKKTPEMVSAGVKLLSALIKGFTKNKKKLFDAVRDIMKAITNTISEEFPGFKSVMDKIQYAFDAVFGFIEKHSSLIQGAIKGILAGFLAYSAAITIFSNLEKGIGLVTVAVKVLRGELELSAALNPYAAAAVALGVIVGLTTTLIEKDKAEKQARFEMLSAISEDTQQAIDFANDYISKLKDTYKANMDIRHSVEEEIKPQQDLVEELKNIVDENGKIKQGYEERADVIIGELSRAFGIEIDKQDGVIQKYDEVMGKIDELIVKKKGEALLDANKQKYSEALSEQVTLYEDMKTAQEEYNSVVQAYNVEATRLINAQNRVASGNLSISEAWTAWHDIDDAKENMEAYIEKLGGLKDGLTETQQAYYANQDFIADYNQLLEVTTSGTGDVEKAVRDMSDGIIESAPQDVLKKQAEEATTYLQNLLKDYDEGVGITEAQLAEATEKAQAAVDALNGAGQDGQAGYANGLKADTDVVEAARQMVDDGLDALAKRQISHSPSKKFMEQGTYAIEGYIKGMESLTSQLKSASEKIVNNAKSVFTRLPSESTKWGSDMINSFISGIRSKTSSLREAVVGVANTVKNNLGHSHPKEGPLADDYKWMPDMMDLFAQGIKDNEGMLTNTIADAFDFGDLVQAPSSLPMANVGGGFANSASVLSAMESEQNSNRNLTVILELEKNELAKAVYQLNNEETQRVGLSLAGGLA